MNAHSEKKNEESVADIIAEMKRTKYGDEDCSVKWCLREWSDRIEAAWKREKAEWEAAACAFVSDAVMSGKVAVEHAPVGNAAAMREALVKIKELLGECYNGELYEKADEAIAVADDALSAPARNCDRLSAEQCKKIFEMEMGIYLPQEATDRDRDIARCTAYGVIDALFAQSTEREGESDGK